MKRIFVLLVVGAACLTVRVADAAIGVNSQQTFNVAPPVADWSTRNIAGGSGAPNDPVTLDAAVQTNTASLFTAAITAAAGNPPAAAGMSQWSSANQRLITRPTGVGYEAILATCQNTTAGTLTSAIISYDLTVSLGVTEEALGHLVYFSRTGDANSWIQIPGISGDNTTGSKLATLDLSANPLPPGGTLYILWADDNGSGTPDTALEIDNFLFATAIACPIISQQPSNTNNIVGRTVSLSVVASGPGLTYQWNKVGSGPIDTGVNPSAATPTLVISNAQASDTGDYTVTVANSCGPVTSASAHIEISPDTFPPRFLSARVVTTNQPPPDLNHFLLITDEQLCSGEPSCGENSLFSFFWRIAQADNELIELGVSSVNMINPTTYEFVTSDSRDPSKAYRIYADDFGSVRDLSGNGVPPGTFAEAAPEVTAISVGATGSVLYNFDLAPEAKEFATFTFAGGSGDYADEVSFDAAVVNMDAANINLALAGAAGTPPAAGAQAQWASDGHYLITRPTGVGGEVILAHLRNDSGETKSGLMIDYDLNVENTVVEEVLGHLVYYSMSGSPGTWQRIVDIDGTVGHKSSILDFSASPWSEGADLYILFADDNGSGTPDDANEIDNFKVSFPASGIPPSITLNPQSVNTNEGATVQLNVAASGSPPLSYQWFKGATALSDGGNTSGATTARLTIADAVPADNGNYFCRVSNGNLPDADSTAATVTISLDTTRPVLTRALSTSDTTVILTFNKPLSPASAQNTIHYVLSGGATVSGAVLANGANNATVTLTTSARGLTATTLTISGVTDSRISANLINPNPTIVLLTGSSIVTGAEWGGSWLYNTNDLDSTPTWKDVGFVAGADWLTGNALFGTETDAATIALFPVPIATVIPPNNVDPFGFITAYFRKTVTLPAIGGGAGYVLEHFIDDGAVFYWDGAEFGRYDMPAGPVVYSTKASTAADATHQSLHLPASANAGGTHTLAVEVHQGGATTSSDMLFGAQIVAVSTPPSLTISHSGGTNIVSWTADSNWRLVRSAVVTGPYAAVAGNPFQVFTVPPAANTNDAFFQLQFNSAP